MTLNFFDEDMGREINSCIDFSKRFFYVGYGDPHEPDDPRSGHAKVETRLETQIKSGLIRLIAHRHPRLHDRILEIQFDQPVLLHEKARLISFLHLRNWDMLSNDDQAIVEGTVKPDPVSVVESKPKTPMDLLDEMARNTMMQAYRVNMPQPTTPYFQIPASVFNSIIGPSSGGTIP